MRCRSDSLCLKNRLVRQSNWSLQRPHISAPRTLGQRADSGPTERLRGFDRSSNAGSVSPDRTAPSSTERAVTRLSSKGPDEPKSFSLAPAQSLSVQEVKRISHANLDDRHRSRRGRVRSPGSGNVHPGRDPRARGRRRALARRVRAAGELNSIVSLASLSASSLFGDP